LEARSTKGLCSKRRQVTTATGQNGDTETATEMAIFQTATNPNNIYSSSEAYIIAYRTTRRQTNSRSVKSRTG